MPDKRVVGRGVERGDITGVIVIREKSASEGGLQASKNPGAPGKPFLSEAEQEASS